MGTFSPETCLELVPSLTRPQVDREYEYFGGTVKLPTKDKRYKLREYLVNLRDAQKVEPTVAGNASAAKYNNPGNVDESNTYSGADMTSSMYNTVGASVMNNAYTAAPAAQVPPPPPPPSGATTNQATNQVAYLATNDMVNSAYISDSSATYPYISQPDTSTAYQYQTLAADSFNVQTSGASDSYNLPNSEQLANFQSTSTDTNNPNSDSLNYLQSICHQINVNVLQLKGEFDLFRRGDGGNHTAVDMDVSDPGEDMDLSDTEMSQKSDEKQSVKKRGTSLNRPYLGQRLAPPLRGSRPPNRGGVSQSRGGNDNVSHPARGHPRGLPRGHDRGSNGRNEYNKPESFIRDQPAPANRGQTRGVSRFSSRGAPPKREMGFRGLGNKEEIPHDLQPVDWQNIAMEEVFKVQYNEHTATKSRPEEEVDSYRDKHQMIVSELCPNPILSFNEVSFPHAIKDVIRNNGFKEPTPIQAQGWSVALSGRDLIGIAQTGSGKTLGFTLPGLIHINAQPPGNEGPIALCLCPTRELAQQVMGVCEEYTRAMRIRSVCLYGGSSKYQQISQISQGVEFAVATPGRLIDLLDTKKVSLKRCSYLVLDEADRMLDMGFEPQITAIVSQIRPDRQTLMWSATWPSEVQELAGKFLTKPVQISIGSEKLVANHAIKQVVMVIEGFEKFDKLKLLLKQINQASRESKTLIFTDTKRMADEIAEELKRDGWPVEAMHGDKRQEERERILRDFKRGQTSILVATDVASRGIDISDITHVINFDYPNTSEDYIHRIGRTARASRTGTAYTFVTPNDSRNIDDLVDVLKEANQEVPTALMMMKECFGGSKPEKKVWVPKAVKRRQEAQARDAERKRLAQSGDNEKPMVAWDDSKEDSDSELETRKRQNWPETDDDWAALYGNSSDAAGDGKCGDEKSGDEKSGSPKQGTPNPESPEQVSSSSPTHETITIEDANDKGSIDEDNVVDPIDWTSLENG